MPRFGIIVVFGSFLAGPIGADDEKVFSGPQPGEKLTPFKVQVFSGPAAGKETELLGKDGKGPVLLIFVHEVTRPALQLLRPLDLYAVKLAKTGLNTQFVWLTADKSKTETFLTTAKKSLALKSPVAISLDGIEGPGNYGLNRKVALTILLGKDHKTVANFAIVQPNETDAPKILQAMAKLLGGKAPTLDELRAELKGPDRPAKDRSPELVALMRRMIQKSNDEATVKKIAREMEEWAGQDRKKLVELREFSQLIVRLGYGTEAAQKELKRLAGK